MDLFAVVGIILLLIAYVLLRLFSKSPRVPKDATRGEGRRGVDDRWFPLPF